MRDIIKLGKATRQETIAALELLNIAPGAFEPLGDKLRDVEEKALCRLVCAGLVQARYPLVLRRSQQGGEFSCTICVHGDDGMVKAVEAAQQQARSVWAMGADEEAFGEVSNTGAEWRITEKGEKAIGIMAEDDPDTFRDLCDYIAAKPDDTYLGPDEFGLGTLVRGGTVRARAASEARLENVRVAIMSAEPVTTMHDVGEVASDTAIARKEPTPPRQRDTGPSAEASQGRTNLDWIGDAIRLVVDDHKRTVKGERPKYPTPAALARAVGKDRTTVSRYLDRHRGENDNVLWRAWDTYRKTFTATEPDADIRGLRDETHGLRITKRT